MKTRVLKITLTSLVAVCLSLNVLAKVAITKSLTDTTKKSKMKMDKMSPDKMSPDKMAPKKDGQDGPWKNVAKNEKRQRQNVKNVIKVNNAERVNLPFLHLPFVLTIY